MWNHNVLRTRSRSNINAKWVQFPTPATVHYNKVVKGCVSGCNTSIYYISRIDQRFSLVLRAHDTSGVVNNLPVFDRKSKKDKCRVCLLGIIYNSRIKVMGERLDSGCRIIRFAGLVERDVCKMSEIRHEESEKAKLCCWGISTVVRVESMNNSLYILHTIIN